MRSLPLMVAVLVAISSMVPMIIAANNSYLDAVRSNQPNAASNPYLEAVRSNRPPLQRSNSDPTANRPLQPQYRISHNDGRSYSNNRGGCSTNYKFDYVMLTLQWGPGSCATSSRGCIKVVQSFTIHGMWPQLRNGELPGFCCFDNQFDIREIDSLLPEMNRLWFSYYSQDSKSFWSHEWLKHGTCFRDVDKLQGEDRYFGNTLKILESLPLLDTLKKDNITPGAGKGNTYSSSAIVDSLRKLTDGKKVQIDCDLEHDQSTPVLTGLNICFDKNMAYIDCPYQKRRCQRDVFFRK